MSRALRTFAADVAAELDIPLAAACTVLLTVTGAVDLLLFLQGVITHG